MMKILAPHELAQKIMNNFFELYQYVALGMGLDIEDEKALKIATEEGTKFAQDEFCALADKFEEAFPGVEIRWVYFDDEEDEDYNEEEENFC